MLGKLKSMISSLRSEVIDYLPIKGAMVKISGNGAADPTIGTSYNIASVVRTGVGVYRGTLTQSTFYGVDLVASGIFSTGFVIAPSVNTAQYLVNFVPVSPGVFDCKVYEVTQGAGIILSITAYDIQVGDTVSATLLLNIDGGRLPPP